MLIPSRHWIKRFIIASLSRRVNANSQLAYMIGVVRAKLIKKGEC